MLTTCSVESFVKGQMEKYGMAALFLGKLCNLYGIPASQTRLSAALRGDSPLPNQVGERVRDLVLEIASAVDALGPLALVDADHIKKILDERRAVRNLLKDDADVVREQLGIE